MKVILLASRVMLAAQKKIIDMIDMNHLSFYSVGFHWLLSVLNTMTRLTWLFIHRHWHYKDL